MAGLREAGFVRPAKAMAAAGPSGRPATFHRKLAEQDQLDQESTDAA
ncbi:hypothetical protein HMPREF9946_01217 [Acetobacteraceae bacterium AT-5844]|nr:hypothetical protein HMPREF9946_01217 [Acetobacteraceae bacterium AT-5844]